MATGSAYSDLPHRTPAGSAGSSILWPAGRLSSPESRGSVPLLPPRSRTDGVTLQTVPSIGGVERKLYMPVSWVPGMDWSPDGARIYSYARDRDGPFIRCYTMRPG